MQGEARSALSGVLSRLFGEIGPEALGDLAERIRPVRLERGDVLYREGEPGAGMHFLITGRLQVRVSDGRTVAYVAPGEVVGEIALFTGQARTATIVAMRDSTLGHLARDEFDAVMARHPQAASHVSRFIIHRLLEAQRRGRDTDARVRTVAVVPLDADLDAAEFVRRLQLALLRFGSTALLDARFMHERFATHLAAGSQGGDVELERFLDAVERDHEYVVLETDLEPSAWSRRCLSYAEGVLFVATASAAVSEASARATTAVRLAGEPRPACDLAIVRPTASTMPRETRRWLEALPIGRHFHVPWAGDEGFSRLARVLSDNAVGIVLGGGGARGFAHIGVVRALREAGVPIDAAGGTSMGAMVAAGVAMGWSDERMLEEYRSAFVYERPTHDYTLPFTSLVRGERFSRALTRHLGDVRIEDLWIPFFAVSSSLSNSRERIHVRGPLWQALRASASVPAIFPPVVDAGELLVDGGLLSNLPVKTMRESMRGHTIAVDLSGNDDFRYERDTVPCGWKYLRARWWPFGDREVIPTIPRVVLRSTMLGSRRELDEARREADLFFNPPTRGFDLLDWRSFHDLVEVGYRHAREGAAAWVESHPEITARDPLFDSRLRRA